MKTFLISLTLLFLFSALRSQEIIRNYDFEKLDAGNTQYSIELAITGDVQSIAFGCKMTGLGHAWFDYFEVWLDEEKL